MCGLKPKMPKDFSSYFPHLFGPKLSITSINFWNCLWVLKLSVLKRTGKRLFIHPWTRGSLSQSNLFTTALTSECQTVAKSYAGFWCPFPPLKLQSAELSKPVTLKVKISINCERKLTWLLTFFWCSSTLPLSWPLSTSLCFFVPPPPLSLCVWPPAYPFPPLPPLFFSHI